MEYLNHIGTNGPAPDEIIRSDGTIYTFDRTTETDEQGAVVHSCKGWFLTQFDLEQVQAGNLPAPYAWDAVLHRLFRTYQHQRADNEYMYAERMRRATDAQKWLDYIASLDEWNAMVSATADGFSIDIPPMPTKPASEDAS